MTQPPFSFHCPNRAVLDAIQGVCNQKGWLLSSSSAKADAVWVSTMDELKKKLTQGTSQLVSKIPGFLELCSKNRLAYELNRAKALFPECYDFWPDNFILPDESARLREAMRSGTNVFIAKPNYGSQGEGIFLATHYDDLLDNCEDGVSYCVQRYVSKPFLGVEQKKFDLRVYVLVTSVDPLKIFVCNDGIARFCSTTYAAPSQSNLNNITMHLSNYSLNKRSSEFVHSGDDPSGGDSSKRSLAVLFRKLRRQGVDTALIWSRIHRLVVNTLLALRPSLLDTTRPFKQAVRRQCFHILGFDVLLDSTLQPWLVEVNSNPSLSVDSVYSLEQFGKIFQRLAVCFPSPDIAPLAAVPYRLWFQDEAGKLSAGKLRGGLAASGGEGLQYCRCSDGPDGLHIHRPCPLDMAIKTSVIGEAVEMVRRERAGMEMMDSGSIFSIVLDDSEEMEVELSSGVPIDLLSQVRELFEETCGGQKSFLDLHRIRRFAIRCGLSISSKLPVLPAMPLLVSGTVLKRSASFPSPAAAFSSDEFDKFVQRNSVKGSGVRAGDVAVSRDGFTNIAIGIAAMIHQDLSLGHALFKLVENYKSSFRQISRVGIPKGIGKKRIPALS